MSQLPRPRSEGEAGHLGDHDELHRLHNALDGTTGIVVSPTAPVSPAVDDLWIGPSAAGAGGVQVLGPFTVSWDDPGLTTTGVPLFTPAVGDVILTAYGLDTVGGDWNLRAGPDRSGSIGDWPSEWNFAGGGTVEASNGLTYGVEPSTQNLRVAVANEWWAWAYPETPAAGSWDVWVVTIPADGSGSYALQRWTGTEWEIVG